MSIRLDDLAIAWGRIEAWCELSSGKAICGPVLERVESKGRELEADRDALREALEKIAALDAGSLDDIDFALARGGEIARDALALSERRSANS